jgi:hypothetical protein
MPVSHSDPNTKRSVYFMPFKTVLKNCSFLDPVKPEILHTVRHQEEMKEVPRNPKDCGKKGRVWGLFICIKQMMLREGEDKIPYEAGNLKLSQSL